MQQVQRLVAAFALAAAAVPAFALLNAASAPAASPRSAARQCFLPRMVNSFDPVDRDTVDVTIGVRDVYRLELLGTCPDVNWSTRIGIRSTHGASWVCQGQDAELLVPGAIGLDRCPVTSVRKLGAEEIAEAKAARKKKH